MLKCDKNQDLISCPRVKNLSGLSPRELASLANLELAIQERIQKRSLLLGPQFRSFDRAGSLAVTNSQFVRVMTTLGFELNKSIETVVKITQQKRKQENRFLH